MTLKRLLLLLAAAAALQSCRPHSEQTVHIISTNDIHGAMQRLPMLAAVVGDYRSQDTAAVLLLDAGDRWTGNAYVDMNPRPGSPIIEIMSALGYDAATFGNHEFDLGMDTLDRRTREAAFPVILANVDAGTSALTQPAPYLILDADGIKVGIVGLVTNYVNGHPDGVDEIYEGMEFYDPQRTAARYAALRDSVDLLIALTHIGYDRDTLLAAALPQYDLIVGGHSHTVVPGGHRVGNTLVTQTGKNLHYAGVTTVTMSDGKIKNMTNRLVPLDDIAPDSAFLARLEPYYNDPYLNHTVGALAGGASKAGLANMISDAVREDAKAPIAFYHVGGVRLDTLAPGRVPRAALYNLEPFRSRAVVLRMTLPQIRDMIMAKYNEKDEQGHPGKEARRADLMPSGLEYTIVTDASGDAVDVRFSGPALQSGGPYRVALSDYASKQYEYEGTPTGDTTALVTDLLSRRLEQAAARGRAVEPDNRMRVRIEDTH